MQGDGAGAGGLGGRPADDALGRSKVREAAPSLLTVAAAALQSCMPALPMQRAMHCLLMHCAPESALARAVLLTFSTAMRLSDKVNKCSPSGFPCCRPFFRRIFRLLISACLRAPRPPPSPSSFQRPGKMATSDPKPALPQSLFAAELSDATIVAHETVNEDKRFTVYKVEISSPKGKFVVLRRYSEFRELYEAVCKAFPRDKFKFPPKKIIGNLNEEFIQARAKGLHEFIQTILANARFANCDAVKAFFANTPRHVSGRLLAGRFLRVLNPFFPPFSFLRVADTCATCRTR